jgi:hypothetical protein
MDEILASALREAVLNRLDYLDKLVTEGDLPSRAALADTEISRLTGAWRALLAQHEPDERRRCPQCWSGWRRRRASPCSVWVSVHEQLIKPDASTNSAWGRHAAAPGRHSIALLAGNSP